MIYKLDGKVYKDKTNLSILQAIEKENKDSTYIAAIVNGEVKDLNHQILKNDDIFLISKYSNIGKQIYSSSLSMILILAVKEVLGAVNVNVEYSIGDGLYVSIKDHNVSRKDIELIYSKMKEITKACISIKKERVSSDVAINLFKSEGYSEKVELIESPSFGPGGHGPGPKDQAPLAALGP